MKNHITDDMQFKPENIVLKDDALHKNHRFFRIETWYYDAVFENKYSIVSLVNVLSIGDCGIVLTGQFIYKDTKIIYAERKKYPYRKFFGHEDFPLIQVDGKQIIKGMIDKNTGNWIYDISMGNTKHGFDLKFKKTTTPWKGRTYLGNWLVIPRFSVDGMIHLDGKDINVTGNGYHDHNIYPIYAPLFNRGYYFGKLTVDSITITWARVIKNHSKVEDIVVINKDQEYINIDSQDISFTIEKQLRDGTKQIPERVYLEVNNDRIKLNVRMETLSFHHIQIPSLNYWRHHLQNVGEIHIDSFSKKINTTDIAEYMQFF